MNDGNFDPDQVSYEDSQKTEAMLAAIKDMKDSFQRFPQIMCLVGSDRNAVMKAFNGTITRIIGQGLMSLIDLNLTIATLVSGADNGMDTTVQDTALGYVPNLLRGCKHGGYYRNPEFEIWFEELPEYIESIREALGDEKKLFCTSVSPAWIDCLLAEEVVLVHEGLQVGITRNLHMKALSEHPLYNKFAEEGYGNVQTILCINQEENAQFNPRIIR